MISFDWQGVSPGNEDEEDPLLNILDSMDGSVTHTSSPLPLIGTPPPAYGGSATVSPLLRRSDSSSGRRRRKANKELLQSSYSACKARINDLKLLIKTAPKKHKSEIDSAIKLYKLLSTMAYSALIFSSIDDLEECIYKLSKGVGNQLVNMNEWSQVIDLCKLEIKQKSERIASFVTPVEAVTDIDTDIGVIERHFHNETDIKNEINNLKNNLEALRSDATNEHEKLAINMTNLRSQLTNLVKNEYNKQMSAVSPNKSASVALKDKNNRLEMEIASLNMKLAAFYSLKEESEKAIIDKYENKLLSLQVSVIDSDKQVSETNSNQFDKAHYEVEISKYKELAASLEKDIITLKDTQQQSLNDHKIHKILHDQLEVAKVKEESLLREITTLKSGVAIKIGNEDFAKLKGDLEEAQKQLEMSLGEGNSTRQQVYDLEEQVSSLIKENGHLKHAIEQMQEQRGRLSNRKQSIAEETINKLTLDLEIATKKVAIFENENHKMSKKIDSLIKDNLSLKHQIVELNAGYSDNGRVEQLKIERDDVTHKCALLSQEHFAIATKCSILSKENKELKFEMGDMHSKKHLHTKQLQGERDTAYKLKEVVEKEFLSLSAKLNFVNKEYQEAKRRLVELQELTERLQTENSELHELCDNQRQFAAVLREQKSDIHTAS